MSTGKVNTVSTVELEQGRGDGPSPAEKTKERLARWYREHGKERRRKRTQTPVANKRHKPDSATSRSRQEDSLSGSESDTGVYPGQTCFSLAEVDAIRDIVWEENPPLRRVLPSGDVTDPLEGPSSLTTTVVNTAVCALGAFGIGKAALENRESIVEIAKKFLGQLTATPGPPLSGSLSAPQLLTPPPPCLLSDSVETEKDKNDDTVKNAGVDC